MRFGFKVAHLGVSLMALTAAAFAQQTAPAAKTDDATNPDIVVTGTLIRGKAPTGGQLITVSSDDIAQLGASDTSQLLAAIPQSSGFNNRPQVGNFGQFQTVNAPILRNLQGNSSGGLSTLLLLDGVRLPGMGILSTTPDIDAIAPGALARIDIATDGGSATYGADAVGGVFNLITHPRFDGVEIGGHYGGAKAFNQWDISATVGKTFSNGSIWVSYNYAQHDLIHNSDRSYVHNLDYTTPGPNYLGADTSCNPGNVVQRTSATTSITAGIIGGTFSFPAGLANPKNRCDLSGFGTFLPSEKRHSVIAGMDVDLSDSISFNAKAYYMHRDASGDGGLRLFNVPTNFPGQSVIGNLQNVFGNHTYTSTKLDTWGVTPKITAKLGHDWQLTAFFNYGQGKAVFTGPTSDATALQAATLSGAFNPFTATFATTAAGAAARDYQANFATFSQGRDEIINARAVVDGPLFALPGGDVRAAAGGEILTENYALRNGTALNTQFSNILANNASRTVKSVFGELLVPLFGESNRTAGFYSLNLSAAGRYDYYSDAGGTFNPKFGIDWQPIEGLTFRGNWGRSFQAPSLASGAKANPPGVAIVPAGTFGQSATVPNTRGGVSIILFPGGDANLKPQKATTWELGFDFRPPAIPGLSAGVTYYNINFKDRISLPSFFSSTFFTLYPNSYTLNPTTGAQVAAFIRDASPSSIQASGVAQYTTDAGALGVYALENALQQNLAITKTSGLDFHLNYKHPTSFGSLFGGIAGTYILKYDTQATIVSPVQHLEANQISRLSLQVDLGAKVGGFTAKGTWRRTDSFAVAPQASNAFQTSVKAFDLFNLAFQYDVGGEGVLKDLSFNVNIDNVFDTNPPVSFTNNSSGAGYAGFTIGRFVQVGFTKKF